MALTCPNCGNDKNFLVKSLQMHVVHLEDARVEVSDTGVGLTPEECERLFTPYYTSKEHGTGLGLAIVQSVINDHGGRISVRSQPGQGTTFVIELPGNMDKVAGTAQEVSARVQ